MFMESHEARHRIVTALERIADALERANEANPLLAIQTALEAEQATVTDDDVPDYIKRLIER